MNKDTQQDLEYQGVALNDEIPPAEKALLPPVEDELATTSIIARFFKLGIPSVISVFFMMLVGTAN